MTRDLTRLPHNLDSEKRTCSAIVETPKGHRTKYDYDPELGLFALKSVLPDGQAFPLDFGFVPSTLCDGDPLDIMILADEPGVTGTHIVVQLIGVEEVEKDRKSGTTGSWPWRRSAISTRKSTPSMIWSRTSSVIWNSSGPTKPSKTAKNSKSSAWAGQMGAEGGEACGQGGQALAD